MPTPRSRRAALAACLLLAPLAGCAGRRPAPAGGADAPPLRVMTFNIRLDLASDGPNAWPNRKDWVPALIRFHGADAVGVQEALHRQLLDLDARLPGWARVGVGRADGREGGEYSAILYRADRLEALASGTFWLSPTPEAPGSKGWDAAIERVATWARFRDRRTGCEHLHLNTHFDHVGETARQESARLIRRRLDSLARGLPVVVTGDLNSNPRSVGYRIFTRDTVAGTRGPLLDAFAVSRDPHYGPTSTWQAFRALEPEQRIDYVLVSPDVAVRSHGILPDSWDGRFPSDHLPVLAALAIPCRR
ncbi:endonuclease/exonuclease/phosphatase family protein [Roseisolibacter sp. H3M3-2]|uniref:endonuclease/exonuclease/phosphatase family protein n=1 Tax=Roseisolibacter sp. H3M3-2 TaxID=3031323 RepID=UPI0023DA9787|nr:endonuclease/exonuclease/phosphatase family protein [Roseisolibacter sp. H3M3-2]MDF1503290.1 endonuclease/exonuclease/phosphatase family protein [Roseisolibacter sp. H3M3-2]